MLLAAGPAGGGLGLQVDVVPLGGQRHIFSGIAHHLFNEDSHGLINIFVLLDRGFCPTCETILFTEPVNLVSAHCPRG